ncbi:hypothetical protein MVG78_18320 [Roseomonas gilardii subsp. gilardii]|uniref:hypothetical protein n=1 Tax=Roseomonas gilardii TaxID=257708 RepID=UPI001FFB0121|nr:hypothetical protein [Roseomonas gilardii]UPG72422.1 hypothetical protein MVG78_18320 [Roseomonas gilardii subsp. gilardii]
MKADSSRPPVTPRPTDPFDLWLRQSLRTQFGDGVFGDGVAKSVPQDLLRLICDSKAEWDSYRERWLPGSSLEGGEGTGTATGDRQQDGISAPVPGPVQRRTG